MFIWRRLRWRDQKKRFYVVMTIISLLISHYFTWRILCNAPSNARARKNIEAFFIAIMRSSLNEQLDSDGLILFRNGVT